MPMFDMPSLSHCPDEAYLLPRRMEVLRLDPGEIAEIEPSLFAQLHHACLLCESQGPCAFDLGDEFDENSVDWYDYCPNAATLRMLAALPGFMH